jgi:hypothetical protein
MKEKIIIIAMSLAFILILSICCGGENQLPTKGEVLNTNENVIKLRSLEDEIKELKTQVEVERHKRITLEQAFKREIEDERRIAEAKFAEERELLMSSLSEFKVLYQTSQTFNEFLTEQNKMLIEALTRAVESTNKVRQAEETTYSIPPPLQRFIPEEKTEVEVE